MDSVQRCWLALRVWLKVTGRWFLKRFDMAGGCNAGQIVQSLGGAADGHDAFVSLFSVMNAVGRLTFGFLPERCMHAFGTPRCVLKPTLRPPTSASGLKS